MAWDDWDNWDDKLDEALDHGFRWLTEDQPRRPQEYSEESSGGISDRNAAKITSALNKLKRALRNLEND